MIVPKGPLITADEVIEHLRIEQPDEIDVEAIAQYCGATVVYETLTGCTARLIGQADRAYITVAEHAPRTYQRFAVGHELGHWLFDRGRFSTACSEETLATQWFTEGEHTYNFEAEVNHFAAQLLMPTKLLKPMAQGLPVTFDSAKRLCRMFESLPIPAAVRLVAVSDAPSLLVCSMEAGALIDGFAYENHRVLWFVSGGNMPPGLQLLPAPGRDTIADRLLTGGWQARRQKQAPDEVPAAEWFQASSARPFTVREHTVSGGNDCVWTLLSWEGVRQQSQGNM